MNKRTKKVTLLDDSERMIPAYHKGKVVYGEHIVRYTSAQHLVKDKVVLDIACGSGYGTHTLARTAKKVYGVDVSADSVAYAEATYGAHNIEYMVGDGEKIPLPDKSVDVVTTFETIEHIPDYKQFMKEVSRVLKDDGLAIISTPNDLEFAEGNHFHLHEFEYKEIMTLIAKHFKNTASYFQGTWVYNALVDERTLSTEQTFDITTMNTAPIDKNKSIYFYILASNRKITESVVPIAAIAEHWSARTNLQDAQALHHKQTLTDDHVRNLESVIAEKDARIEDLKSQIQAIERNLGYRVSLRIKNIGKH